MASDLNRLFVDPSSSTAPPQRTVPVQRAITVAEAFLHLAKGNLGPGVLALPMQFAIVGPVNGVIVLSFVAVQGVYTMWLLSEAQQRAAALEESRAIAGSTSLTFEDLGQLAFGRRGRMAVRTCVLAMQLSICSVFMSLVGENLVTALGEVGSPGLTRIQGVLFAFAPCVLLSLLPNLSSLWPLSGFGTLAMLTALTSAVIAAANEIVHGTAAAGAVTAASISSTAAPPPFLSPPYLPMLPPPTARDPTSPPTALDLGAATAAAFYALEGVAIVLPVGNALAPQMRRHYPSIVTCALSFVVVCFGVSATLTAIGFPDIDEASVTSYLAHTFEHGAAPATASYFASVNVLVTLAVIATFPLQLTPAVLILYDFGGWCTSWAQRLVRVATVCTCLLVVLAVPNLSLLINLVGSVVNTCLAILPLAIHASLLLSLPGFRVGSGPRPLERLPPTAPPLPAELGAVDSTWDHVSRVDGASAAGGCSTSTSGTRATLPAAEPSGMPALELHWSPLRVHERVALLIDGLGTLFCLAVMALGVAATITDLS